MEAFNIEHKILNKQPKHIAYIWGSVAAAVAPAVISAVTKGFGSDKSGGTSSQTHSNITGKQTEQLNKSMSDLSAVGTGAKKAELFVDTSVVGDTSYSGPAASALKSAADPGTPGKFRGVDESGVSLGGLEKLRTTAALAGVQGNVDALSGVGSTADFADRRERALAEAGRLAQDRQVGINRETSSGGARFETGRDRMTSENMRAYGEAVGHAVAAYEFDSRIKAEEMALKGNEAAGRLAMAGMGLDVEAGKGEAEMTMKAFTTAARLDMESWKGLMDNKIKVDQVSLQRARDEVDSKLRAGTLSVQEAQMLNNSILAKEKQFTDTQIQALSAAGTLAATGTQDTAVTQTKGSSMTGSLVGVAGNVLGGMASSGAFNDPAPATT